MVTIDITRQGGRITALEAQGHALMGSPGGDVVCAAVSAVLQTALIGVTDYAGVRVGSEVQEGYMRVVLPGQMSREAGQKTEAILETMLLGLRSIESGNKQALRIREP